MNERKLLKDINKWRKKFNEASEQLKLAKSVYIVYMANQCPDFIDKENPLLAPTKYIEHYYPNGTPVPQYIKEAFNE